MTHPLGKPPILTITGGAGEDVTITNFSGTLPEANTVKGRNALVNAGKTAGLALGENGLRAISRAVVDPIAAATTIKSGTLTTEVVGSVDIEILTANVVLPEVFVLMQPRTGGFAHSISAPEIKGSVDDDGPQVQLEVEFADERHLRAYISETVVLTKAHGRDYADSILAKRVSRPGLAHVVKIGFADGSPSFFVLCVRDGITRVVSSWSTQHPELNPADLGAFIADQLLARSDVRTATPSESMCRARGREKVAADLRGRFVAGMADTEPSEDAVRIGQSFSLPMQICVNIHERAENPVATDAVFEDTMQAVIASVHGEFRPWEPAATQTSNILRVLPRAVHAGYLEAGVAQVAVGALGLESMKRVFGHSAPEEPLWRAVYLMSYLTHDFEWEGIKRQLRDLSGLKQVTHRTYVTHLMTLMDLPWRREKVNTERQARRAWSNGGPVPRSMLGTDWNPVPTDDFLTLVDPALGGDIDAKNTLTIAGGIALITDKLLLASVGSAETSGLVPFRANVDVVVEGLGDSEFGLCLLAHAANSFDAGRPARNSYTANELAANPSLAANTYVVPLPAEDNPRQVARDGNSKVIPLTQYDVVFASDPVRAAKETDDTHPEDESPVERANRLRRRLVTLLDDSGFVADELGTLASTDGAVAGGPFGDSETYRAVDEMIRKLQLFVLVHAGTVPDNSAAYSISDEEA